MPPASDKPSLLSSGRRRLQWWLSLIEWLRPTELQITLVLAGLTGFLGALGSLAFRHATEIVHWVFTGSWGAGLTESFARLPWWQRIVVPTVGGAAAGLVLMFTARFLKQRRTTDYMEAVVIGDGILSVRQSLLKSLSALFSISSGASIGREGPLVQLAAMLASALGRIMHVPVHGYGCWWRAAPQRESPRPITPRCPVRSSSRKLSWERRLWKFSGRWSAPQLSLPLQYASSLAPTRFTRSRISF